jgi:hypothetical protein
LFPSPCTPGERAGVRGILFFFPILFLFPIPILFDFLDWEED